MTKPSADVWQEWMERPEPIDELYAEWAKENGLTDIPSIPDDPPVGEEEGQDTKSAIATEMDSLIKERIYVDDPSEVPEGAEPQQGDQGGVFYETDDIHGSGEESEEGPPWDNATFEEMGEVLVDIVGEDEVELLADVLPESASTGDAVTMMEERMESSYEYDQDDIHELYMEIGDAFGSPLGAPAEEEESEEGGEGEDQESDGSETDDVEVPDTLVGNLTIDDAAEIVAGVAGEKAAYALLGDMRAPDSGEQPNPESYVTQAARGLPREGKGRLQELLNQEAQEQEQRQQRAEEHASEVPDTPDEALERIEEALKEDVAEENMDGAIENWSQILNGEVNALEGVDEEREEAVEQGLQQLQDNEEFSSLLESHDISPAVIVADPEKLNQNAGYSKFSEGAEAERSANVTWMHDNPLATRQVEPEKPAPGKYVSSGDVGSVLRHEMTHDLWDEMGSDFKQWFQFEGTPDDEKIAEGLTEYATGRPEEAFTELIATTTNPKYDPDDFPDWVDELAEDVKARVRGEKETEFDPDDIGDGEKSKGDTECVLERNTLTKQTAEDARKHRINQTENERRESFVKVQDLQTPDIDIEKNKTFRKAGENFELVDNLLMEAFEKQIWEDDMVKAPNMWRRDDEVPQFVRSHVKEAIDKADALHGDYNDIPHTAALKVHEIIKDQLTDPQGWSIETVAKELQEEFPQFTIDHAEDIARTEVASVLNKAREIAYDAAQAASAANAARNITGLPGEDDAPGEDEGVMYYWAGPEDHATTNICSETKDEIERRGGYVEKDELKEILREKAKKYKEEDGGLPDRVDSFVPHFQCRHTFIREDYQRVT